MDTYLLLKMTMGCFDKFKWCNSKDYQSHTLAHLVEKKMFEQICIVRVAGAIERGSRDGCFLFTVHSIKTRNLSHAQVCHNVLLLERDERFHIMTS